MPPRFALLAFHLVLVTLGLALAATASAVPPHADRDADRVYDDLEAKLRDVPATRDVRIIVALRAPATASRVGMLERDVHSLDSRRRFATVNGFAAVVEAGRVRELAALAEVAHVELDVPVRTFNSSAQHSFGVTAARTSDSRLDGDGDGDVTVYSKNDMVAAVIDSGIDPAHVNLDGGKVIAFKDYTDAAKTAAYDDNGHGTHVAATIAGDGNGSADGRGVAPAAALVGLKVLDASGSGYTSDVIAAIEWSTTNRSLYGIDVINMSLGSSGCSDGRGTEAAAINAAVAAGIVVAVAAGNEGAGRCTIGAPAAVDSAVTVGAMADQGVGGFFMADFSSRGTTLDGRIKPDVVAPGVRIRSAAANTGTRYATYSGTSMATPFVAGLALLMRDHDRGLTPAAIKQAIRSTAIDWGRGGDAKVAGTTGPDIDHGAGRIDAHAALASLGASVGSAPLVAAHQVLDGSLNVAGAKAVYTLTTEGSAVPVAVTLTLGADDVNGDGFSDLTTDPLANPACHAVDFNMYLYDSDNQKVTVNDGNGDIVDGAVGCLRSDVLWLPAGPSRQYTLQVESSAGSGSYFLDVSGGSAVAISPEPAGGTPTVSGGTTDGATLTASRGTWTGQEPMTFAYQWQRCAADGSGCADVEGASGTTYLLGPPDVGSKLQVVVTASNAAGTAAATAAPTDVVSARAPVAATDPTVSGTARDGETMSATDGTWNGTAPLTLARQWLRCDSLGGACVQIAGATGSTYGLVAGDVGARLRVRVTATNAAGSASVRSAATQLVAAKPVAVQEQPTDGALDAAGSPESQPVDDPAAFETMTTMTARQPLRAVRLRIDCSAACAVRTKLKAVKSLSNVLGKRRRVIAARRLVLEPGRHVVKVALKRRALKRLRRAGVVKAKGVLTVSVTDPAGQVTRSKRFVRVRIR